MSGVWILLATMGCLAVLLLLAFLIRRTSEIPALKLGIEGVERAIREEMRGNRAETQAQVKVLREETLGQARVLREEVGNSLTNATNSLVRSLQAITEAQSQQLKGHADQLGKLTESLQGRFDHLRGSIEERLKSLQDENAAKLERIRLTVDEKLQNTLEARLGESFKQVSERLEQVHRGLGEMQALATGVGDLKRVLGNVKARGVFGEIQLERLLEDVLPPELYDRNVATGGSLERVEFALRLPGRGDDPSRPVWVPIDAKFPQEDYQRLIDAQARGDAEAAETAGRQLEQRIKAHARDISTKYLNPPQTTDFGIMFLPTEGLFAEAVRRAGLTEFVQGEHRITITGPTTLWALLNSLQMGFRTLAIQRRSSEVWGLLGAVKSEFGAFGELLANVKKKLDSASNEIERAARKSSTITRRLREVEALPSEPADVPRPALPSGEAEPAEAVLFQIGPPVPLLDPQ